MITYIAGHAAPTPSSPGYLVWCQQFNPSGCTEGERLQAIACLAENYQAVPETKQEALDLMRQWLDALQWTLSPLHYSSSYYAMKKHEVTFPCDEKSLADTFRFQLMEALHEDISYANFHANRMAHRMGQPLATPADDFLKMWGDTHTVPQLLQTKSILDQLHSKPSNPDNRDECMQYARSMFRSLHQVYQIQAAPALDAIALPCDLTATQGR